MRVVSTTSPLNYLVLIGREQVLPALYIRVIIPEAVLRELTRPSTPSIVRGWAQSAPSWLEVQPDSTRTHPVLDRHWLDAGEHQALLLAEELQADAVRLDERKGRLAARALGFIPAGTLAVLERGAHIGHLVLSEALRDLRQTSFRAGADLWRDYEQVAEALDRGKSPERNGPER